MKSGIVASWNEEKGFGTILVPSVVGERYFFYANKIIGGPQPTVGARVFFHQSSKPVRPGQIPYAEGIVVVNEAQDAGFTSGGAV